jgi:hypothetical protein
MIKYDIKTTNGERTTLTIYCALSTGSGAKEDLSTTEIDAAFWIISSILGLYTRNIR